MSAAIASTATVYGIAALLLPLRWVARYTARLSFLITAVRELAMLIAFAASLTQWTFDIPLLASNILSNPDRKGQRTTLSGGVVCWNAALAFVRDDSALTLFQLINRLGNTTRTSYLQCVVLGACLAVSTVAAVEGVSDYDVSGENLGSLQPEVSIHESTLHIIAELLLLAVGLLFLARACYHPSEVVRRWKRIDTLMVCIHCLPRLPCIGVSVVILIFASRANSDHGMILAITRQLLLSLNFVASMVPFTTFGWQNLRLYITAKCEDAGEGCPVSTSERPCSNTESTIEA